MQVLAGTLNLHGRFFGFMTGLDFGVLGYVIVGLFLLAWALSVALWKFGLSQPAALGPAGAACAHPPARGAPAPYPPPPAPLITVLPLRGVQWQFRCHPQTGWLA